MKRFTVQSADFRLNGALAITDAVADLHPQLRRWREAYGLEGTVAWDLGIEMAPESLSVCGHLDASNAAFSVATGDPFTPAVAKAAGVPLALDVENAEAASVGGEGLAAVAELVLAHEGRGVVALRLQYLGEARPIRFEVPRAGQHLEHRGHRAGRGAGGVPEDLPGREEGVDVGGGVALVAVDAEAVAAQGVDDDQHDVERATGARAG